MNEFVRFAGVVLVFSIGFLFVSAGSRLVLRSLPKPNVDPDIERLVDKIMALPPEDRAVLRALAEQWIEDDDAT